MSLVSGASLGPYELTGSLGAGAAGIMGPPSIVRNHNIMPDGKRFLGLVGADDSRNRPAVNFTSSSIGSRS